MKDIFSTSLVFHEDNLKRSFKDLADIKDYPPLKLNETHPEKSFEKRYLFNNTSLLMIDNDSLILETISSLLKLRGYNVFTATDINEGFKIYQNLENKIDMIILNIEIENADYRLSIPGLFSINDNSKIVGVSKYLLKEEIPEYFRNNLYGFLSKPFLIKDLLKIITKKS